ncbi:hypothetical protein [Streptosporangium sp. NPDC004631]
MRKPLITFAGLAVAALAVSGGVAFAAQDDNEPRPAGTIFVAPPLFETKASSSAIQDDPGRQTGSPDGKAGNTGDDKCEWDDDDADDADDRAEDKRERAEDKAEDKREQAEDKAEDRWDDDADDADDRAENERERAEEKAEDKREQAEDKAEDKREARDGCE